MKPDNKSTSMRSTPCCSVEDILNSSFPMWFTDLDSAGVCENEVCSIESGFASSKDSIGRTMLDVAPKNDALRIINNDIDTMKSGVTKIIEESWIRNKDQALMNAISIKKPWYSDDNKITGIFGCSVILGKQPLAQTLDKIMQLGFLNPCTSLSTLVGQEIDSIYLSKREMDCLRLAIRGKTSKEIAKVLNLSKWTVEEYLANLKLKLRVKTKSELIDKTIDYFLK